MPEKLNCDKDLFRRVCATHHSIPVFFRDWFLDITCGVDNWQVIMYVEDPEVVAFFTYYLKKGPFFKQITMPVFTKFMGPYFIRNFDDRKSQSILNKMVGALPDVPGFAQTVYYSIQNWLPWKWKGYSQTQYYSYVLRDVKNLEKIWDGIDADYRNNKISKARTIVTIRQDLDRNKLWELFNLPFSRQQIKVPFETDVLFRLMDILEEKGTGRSFYAEDESGEVLAAAVLFWDRKSAYLLMTGENETSRSQGTGIYLIWKMIEYVSKNLPVNTFDFLGGMAENLERTRRQFGAIQQPYFLIYKYHWWFGLLRWFKK